ncbi:MAG: ribosomal-processing cysteine protease Prp [Clostridia bacterium]|nr:ribosomal-processing cysteine protease Prp [Clostridia bacterium]
MTKVVFITLEDGRLWGFEASGHAGYGEYGTDIVCAAISALTQSTVGGITEVIGAKVHHRMDEKTGYLQMTLSNETDEETVEKAQILLKTLKMALTEISKDYPGTIRIINRERR